MAVMHGENKEVPVKVLSWAHSLVFPYTCYNVCKLKQGRLKVKIDNLIFFFPLGFWRYTTITRRKNDFETRPLTYFHTPVFQGLDFFVGYFWWSMTASTQQLRMVNYILDETLFSQGYAIFIYIHHVPDMSKNFNQVFSKAPRFKLQLCHIVLGKPFKVTEAHFFLICKTDFKSCYSSTLREKKKWILINVFCGKTVTAVCICYKCS